MWWLSGWSETELCFLTKLLPSEVVSDVIHAFDVLVNEGTGSEFSASCIAWNTETNSLVSCIPAGSFQPTVAIYKNSPRKTENVLFSFNLTHYYLNWSFIEHYFHRNYTLKYKVTLSRGFVCLLATETTQLTTYSNF